MSPEMEKGKCNGKNADIFAIGVIIFYMYSCSPPFIGTNKNDPFYKHLINGDVDKFWEQH